MRRFLIFLFLAFYPLFLRAEIITLSSGIKRSLREENLIKVKEYEEAALRAESLIARSGLLPHLGLSYGRVFLEHEMKAKNTLPSPMGPQIMEIPTSEKDFYTYEIRMRQLLFDFFGTYSLYHSTKILTEAKKMEVERTKNYVALQFAKSYFDLLEVEKMIAACEKEVERFESHLKDAQSLYEEGVITKSDLLQAELMLSDAKQRLINAKNMREIIASTINKMLGRPFQERLEVEEIKRDLPYLKSLDEYFEEAQRERIEIKIIEYMKKHLEALERSKKAQFFPQFFIETKYSYTQNKYQVYEGMWSFIIGMNLSLFEGGKRKAEILKIEREKGKTFFEERKLKDEIKLEVEKYYIDLVNAKERIKVAEGAIKQAEENLRINRIKYREGAGTGTEVIDAITMLHLAETNYYRAYYDLLRSEAGLLYATGRNLLEVYER